MEVPIHIGNLPLFYRAKDNGVFQYEHSFWEKNGDHCQLF